MTDNNLPRVGSQGAPPLIPSVWDKNSRGWPRYAEGARARYLPLGAVLSCLFETDVHFGAYSCPGLERRLDGDAPPHISWGVPMVLFVADVDDPEAHRLKVPAREAWRWGEQPKIDALLRAHPGLFLYQSQGGYRIVGWLAEAFVIRTPADADAWSSLYRRWLAYLKRFQIIADAACADWTRLYRVPRATRNGTLQSFPVMGDENAVGVWNPTLGSQDVGAPVRGRPRKVSIARMSVTAPADDTRPDESALPALAERIAWARSWITRQPPSIEGQGGSVACFNTILGLVRGWILPVDIARAVFDELYNHEPRCSPPWEDDLVEHKIDQVLDRAAKPWGYILTDYLERTRLEKGIAAARAAYLSSYRKDMST